jgi:hypothetical protein
VGSVYTLFISLEHAQETVSINTKMKPVVLAETHWHICIENSCSVNSRFILKMLHSVFRNAQKRTDQKKQQQQLPGQLASFTCLSILVSCASSRDMNRVYKPVNATYFYSVFRACIHGTLGRWTPHFWRPTKFRLLNKSTYFEHLSVFDTMISIKTIVEPS